MLTLFAHELVVELTLHTLAKEGFECMQFENHSDCVYTVFSLLLIVRYSVTSNCGAVAECLVSNLAIRVRVTATIFFCKILCSLL